MMVPFHQEVQRTSAGCKGYNLSRMWRAGLPVPAGFCVTCEGIDSVCPAELEAALAQLGAASVAVRSSASAEDAIDTSFAGMLLSRLNLTAAADVLLALNDIRNSAWAPAAAGYSGRLNVPCSHRIAAIVQRFLPAEASGVLFMRDPTTGEGHFVVEASWGLGPGVVEGLVRPDQWIVSAAGHIVSEQIADKDVAIIPAEPGGTKQTPVSPTCRRRPCLTPEFLQELSQLAVECGRLFGSPQDIEWAVCDNQVWLLQSRPITGRV
jgi:pyruvate,water dikinase